MADSSFDIVSKIDQMELDNAFNQCDRELATRFDFKNTGTKIEKSGAKVVIESDTEERAKAALDVFKDKLIKRSVSLKHHLKDSGPKSIKAQIQGDELRVSSKSRDDLQAAIALIKKETWEFAVQFTNYR